MESHNEVSLQQCTYEAVRDKGSWSVTNVCRLLRAVKNCDKTYAERERTALAGGGGNFFSSSGPVVCSKDKLDKRSRSSSHSTYKTVLSCQLGCNGSQMHNVFLNQGMLGWNDRGTIAVQINVIPTGFGCQAQFFYRLHASISSPSLSSICPILCMFLFQLLFLHPCSCDFVLLSAHCFLLPCVCLSLSL